jgi:hypothetical protein
VERRHDDVTQSGRRLTVSVVPWSSAPMGSLSYRKLDSSFDWNAARSDIAADRESREAELGAASADVQAAAIVFGPAIDAAVASLLLWLR